VVGGGERIVAFGRALWVRGLHGGFVLDGTFVLAALS
jgi:hypothetical protein